MIEELDDTRAEDDSTSTDGEIDEKTDSDDTCILFSDKIDDKIVDIDCCNIVDRDSSKLIDVVDDSNSSDFVGDRLTELLILSDMLDSSSNVDCEGLAFMVEEKLEAMSKDCEEAISCTDELSIVDEGASFDRLLTDGEILEVLMLTVANCSTEV